jgi:putative transcriptional regulator
MRVICKVKQLMDARGLSQLQVSRETGINPAAISKLYRNQITRYDTKTLETLAEYFGCRSISELIELAEE